MHENDDAMYAAMDIAMTTGAYVMTNSEMRTFRECPRKWENRYLKCLKPYQIDPNLEYGRAWHEQLERLYKGEPAAHELLADYVRVPGTIVAVEKELSMRVGELNFAGKLDLIVKQEDGEYIVEHKTTKASIDPGSVYWQQMQYSSQLTMYRMLYPKAKGVIVDVVQRCRKPRYRQELIVHTVEELDRAKDVLISWANRLKHALLFPKNTDACFNGFRQCEYMSLCHGGFGNFRVGRRHEELSSDF